ncbi:hypothetical protein [Halalkalibacter nanhaiisediminis]|uniref:Uncharacterized protein n=1 Tax=Halalkalibacter nanhaiisediminis TaxID=688079 RepID=A0A562QK83_9BACI|nr:hypothetical protein [Halalkalibacter nanhaiisediminis]TWI57188.1 hypothetical protein IQ10_01894 [Halalkalibacter nanhaiisediminis]
MKKRYGFSFFVIVAILLFTSWHSVEANNHVYFYIDGQEQRYQGDIVINQDGMWVPLRPVFENLSYIHNDWGLDSRTINQFIRAQRNEHNKEELHEIVTDYPFLMDIKVKQINNRAMIHLDNVYQLGFDAFYFESEQILHINTPALMEIAGLRIGDNISGVNRLFPDVHWNTAFGQEADFIGFIGDMEEYSFIDRYGYERVEEVPELQVEIKNNQVTYLIASSERFPTSKGIKVGDRLNDVYRAYGNQYVRERLDDKQIVVYDVELGSIWFIANRDQEIERIAYWDHQLRGFGENQVEELEETDLEVR